MAKPFGIVYRRAYRRDVSVESVVRLHDQGMTNRQVAAVLGIYPSLVQRRLVEARNHG